MLEVRSIALGIALLLAMVADSSAQSRRTRNDPPRAQATQPAAADQRGTENAPLIVKVVPAPEDGEEAKRKTKQEEDKSNADWWLVKLTGVLAAIGFLQLLVFGWQGIQLRKTVAVSRRQASIMMAVESPMPLVADIKLVEYTQIPGETAVAERLPPGPIAPNCRILIAVENKGRAPARMIELCIQKVSGVALPDKPTYTHITPWGLVLEKGPIWIRDDDQRIAVTAADLAAASTAYLHAGAFWVFGYFAYWNLLKERVEYKFAFRWDLTNGFVAENRPGYN